MVGSATPSRHTQGVTDSPGGTGITFVSFQPAGPAGPGRHATMRRMRVFTVSDLHVDHEANRQWLAQLSERDFRDDALILAGDVSDRPDRLRACLEALVRRFRQVLFVPGNHELWVVRDAPALDSLQKFDAVRHLARECGATVDAWQRGPVRIVPLQSWYDYSFGPPAGALRAAWNDFQACRWPDGWDAARITQHFLALNEPLLAPRVAVPGELLISFSHFLPRIDVMPERIPPDKRILYPVLGSAALGEQVQRLQPAMHVYGHSHVNRRVRLDGIEYVNNAFAYPQETRIAAKRLLCLHGE